jgi:hypothetical protein
MTEQECPKCHQAIEPEEFDIDEADIIDGVAVHTYDCASKLEEDADRLESQIKRES